MTFEIASRTDVGQVRKKNEDTLAVSVPDLSGAGAVICVADGMGGHPAGDEASGCVSAAIARYPEVAEMALLGAKDSVHEALALALEQLLSSAHEAIIEIGWKESKKYGLGTTALAGLLREDRLTLFNVGDSGAYRLRGGELSQLNREHVIIEDGVRYLSAHLGMPDSYVLDRSEHDLRSGDRIVLCSDGLTDMIEKPTLAELLGAAASPDEATRVLVDAANEAGGVDNITVVVAHCL